MSWASEVRVDVERAGTKGNLILKKPGKKYHMKCVGCRKTSTFRVGKVRPKACPKCGKKGR